MERMNDEEDDDGGGGGSSGAMVMRRMGKVGSVRWLEIFIFSILPTPADWIYHLNTPDQIYYNHHSPIQIIYDPLHSHSNYYIWF